MELLYFGCIIIIIIIRDYIALPSFTRGGRRDRLCACVAVSVSVYVVTAVTLLPGRAGLNSGYVPQTGRFAPAQRALQTSWKDRLASHFERRRLVGLKRQLCACTLVSSDTFSGGSVARVSFSRVLRRSPASKECPESWPRTGSKKSGFPPRMTSRRPGAVRACNIIIIIIIIIKRFSDYSNHRLSLSRPTVWRFIRSFIGNVTGMLSVDLLHPYNSSLHARVSRFQAGITCLFYIYFYK